MDVAVTTNINGKRVQKRLVRILYLPLHPAKFQKNYRRRKKQHGQDSKQNDEEHLLPEPIPVMLVAL